METKLIRDLKLISRSMVGILEDPKASRLERLEAARVLASVNGVLLPSALDPALPSKVVARLALARQAITQKLFEAREKKAAKNRRQYLKRTGQQEALAAFNAEVQAQTTSEPDTQDNTHDIWAALLADAGDSDA